jgi:quercetin dioxygenase-like cupin family protein
MPPYEIKENRQVAAAAGLLVRELIFAPGEATPWHRHSRMRDRCYGLAGAITVENEGAAPRILRPGEVCETEAGVVHRLVNATDADARVLVVQQGGAYDFVRA